MLLGRRCRDCVHRFFGSFVAVQLGVRLRSFDDFPFLSDRKLRHFDRKQQGSSLAVKFLLVVAEAITAYSSLLLEQWKNLQPDFPRTFLTQHEEGFRDGYRDGVPFGEVEGREVGLKHGFQVGEELGFYRGCVEVWKSAIRIDPNSFSSSVQKRIDQLSELSENYPLFQPENENVQEMMDSIRLKFRIISANLGVKLDHEGHSHTSKQDLEDIAI
ncbi:hypothetical protein IEQ34_012066 [Dendrobium chrysotoxum]|uniref:Essential protein Yae1 N-terminal domain-containing protein n=1 Tax=Dendrobium chrysotoxum TaxID=161865 RepID=A0AAV7GS90_DENCH|nr:hypothetical protein IEQ34_012066 [Dendrobium chrysotoxum]